MHQSWFTVVTFAVACVSLSEGHGRFIDPPSRGSMWRFGFKTPRNYNDNELFCGGRERQWIRNGGRCGVCGDPYDAKVREHEAGGRYATGTIARTYQRGEVINAVVDLTANHYGWFEFRLCVNNNPKRAVTQDCLDKHLLKLADGSGTRYKLPSRMSQKFTVKLLLPENVVCSQCVIQWKYNTGNSWGKDRETGRECVGCGPQEQFYGCSDVAIVGGAGSNTPSTTPIPTTTKQSTTKRTSRQTSSSVSSQSTLNTATTKITRRSSPVARTPKPWPTRIPGIVCEGIGAWAGDRGKARWCENNCSHVPSYCPERFCSCRRTTKSPRDIERDLRSLLNLYQNNMI